MTDSYAGSINPGDVATLSLLGGRGGYGIGGGGYDYGGSYGGQFANDGSNAVRINSSEKLSAQAHAFNRDAVDSSHDAISQQISDNSDRNRDLQAFGQQSTNADRLNDKLNDQSRFFTAELNQVQREAAQNARDAAKCCCEAQLLAVQNQAKTDAAMATITANQLADTRVLTAVANANQNAKLDVLLSNGRGHPGNG
jgi:hypothetical protein